MPVPKEKHSKILCVDDLRHAEYYQMQKTFDELYNKSKNNEIFTDLMDLILARENILLAYRNIKTNQGSKTAGTDGLTINNIVKLSPEDVVYKVNYILCGCHHKKPECDGGTDKYANLILILTPVHRLIHATTAETIEKYLTLLNLNNTQIQKVNKLRELVGNEPIR